MVRSSRGHLRGLLHGESATDAFSKDSLLSSLQVDPIKQLWSLRAKNVLVVYQAGVVWEVDILCKKFTEGLPIVDH